MNVKCPICSINFTSQKAMLGHMWRQHRSELLVAQVIEDEKPDDLYSAVGDFREDHPEPISVGAQHHSAGKLRMDLIPPEAIQGIARVLTAVSESRKYPDRDWEKGMPASELFASAQRHLWAWMGGEQLDPQMKVEHYWMAVVNLVMMGTLLHRNPDLDDRPLTLPVEDILRGGYTTPVRATDTGTDGPQQGEGATGIAAGTSSAMDEPERGRDGAGSLHDGGTVCGPIWVSRDPPYVDGIGDFKGEIAHTGCRWPHCSGGQTPGGFEKEWEKPNPSVEKAARKVTHELTSWMAKEPAFEFHGGGQTFKVWANGMIEGFPDSVGGMILNRIPAMVYDAKLVSDIAAIQKRVRDWADSTFGKDRNPYEALRKLVMEEVPELIRSPKSPEEYADCVILILDHADLNGIDVYSAVMKKMAVNESAQWTIDPVTGLRKRVKEVDHP